MIKYPNGSKNDTSKIPTENKIKLHNLNKAHLGMTFEDMIIIVLFAFVKQNI